MASFSLQDSTVVVTGAAMGMGRLFALRAASEGARHLVLWDVDTARLAQVADEVRALGAEALTETIDITDLDAVEVAASHVLRTIGTPDLLINNAGIVRGAWFWEHDTRRDTETTLAVNTLAPMAITRAFIDAMRAPGRERRILNIASAAATVSNPRMSVYAASKWAMLGWSDSLRLELEQTGQRHLKVTTFCPGYIATGMFAGAKGPLLTPILAPEVAVERAWKAMLRGQPIRLTPWTARLALLLKGLLPRSAFDWIADHVFGVYRSMEHFTGREKK